MNNWIAVEDELPDYSVRVLAYWRPVDHKERPFHREIIIAERSVHLPEGGASLDSDQWWANGRYYDTETFITHWMELPSAPERQHRR